MPALTGRMRLRLRARANVCHEGKREPSKSAPQEMDPQVSRDPGYRMPRIVAELATARPIDLAIIDGVESIAAGEGPWIRGIRSVQPGLLIAGTNAVCTDTVATAAMGYDPRAPRDTPPFRNMRQHTAAGRGELASARRTSSGSKLRVCRSRKRCTGSRLRVRIGRLAFSLVLAASSAGFAQTTHGSMFPAVRGTR